MHRSMLASRCPTQTQFSQQSEAGKTIFKAGYIAHGFKMGALAITVLLSACQSSEVESKAVQENQQEHEIAAQISVSCEQQHVAARELFDCVSASQGTIPVTHPQEIVEIDVKEPTVELPVEPPVEPDNYVKIPEKEEIITDIWQRVKMQFSFEVPDNSRVRAQRNWYLNHPNYMQRVAARAKPFIYLIVEKIEQNNLPLELVLLPIVESAFDPFAYSHGRAAGMWQFIPSTGKRFGMKQSWWYDGRRDVIASTDGAIAYLKYLNKMFDGNWLHALAAYNSGEGRVRRAIKRNNKVGKPTDFWSLDLPRETRAYVPKLLALGDILANTEKYNFTWPEIVNSPLTKVIDIKEQIDLALAADLAGLTLKELHTLNSGFNRWATDPNGPNRLLIPIDKADNFELALNDLDDKDRLNWVRHKVKSGDSLLKLAKRYHTTAAIIQNVNDLSGNIIRIGDHILVPVALMSLDKYSLSQEQRLASTQSKQRNGYQLKHKVISGDTMWDISREYKVDLRSLAKWNGMAPTDPLRPGSELVIWAKQTSESQQNGAVMRSLTYTVRKGDSLARIASKFKVLISDLKRWNQNNLSKYLQPGQKLKLYVDVTRT